LTEEKSASRDESEKPSSPEAGDTLSRYGELPANERLFSSILEQLSEAIVVCDYSGRIIGHSESARELAGRDMMHESFDEIFPIMMSASADGSDDEQGRLFSIAEVIGGLTVRSVETRYWRDEQEFFLVVNAGPIFGDSGEVMGSVVTLTDVTQLSLAREQLAESEAKYTSLVEGANSIVVRTDMAGVITFINTFGEQFFGWEPGELIGRKASKTFVPETDELTGRDLRTMLADLLAHPENYVINENQNVRKNGERVFVTWTNRPILDRRGATVGIQAIGIDATLRRQAEEDLKTYKFLSDSSAEGIVIMNDDNRCVYANTAYESILGYGPGELFGKPLREMVLTEDESDVPGKVDHALDESGTWSGEIKYRRKDSSVIPVLVSASALRDDRGTFIGRVVMVRDISELKENEEQLKRTNEALDHYACTVSHDLRSPFSAILLSNEMLRDAAMAAPEGKLREEAMESAGVVHRNIEKSYALVNDLLKLAQAGEEPADVDDVEIESVVGRILLELRPEIENRRVEVHVDEDMGVVHANETQMYQLFSNLISNAVKHNDAECPEARVIFKGIDRDGFYSYEVYDNGSGIPEEDLDRVFMPFFRQGKTAETGIGLSTVEKVVKLYGGEIRAFNREGPCFAFRIRDWQ